MKSRHVLAAVTLLALTACGGDLCHREADLTSKNSALTCTFGDAGDPFLAGRVDQVAIDKCENALKSCSATDQNLLAQDLQCNESLPPIQCQWYTDMAHGTTDLAFTIYEVDVTRCNAQAQARDEQLSVGCAAAFSNPG